MRIVSLFSGAGGLDLGLIKAGHNIVWANDIDKDACETYRLNIGNHIMCQDISIIDINKIPNADVIVGGFPCQGFSIANLNRSIDDSRNIMYQYFRDIIKEKQPKYFVAENVRGILSLGNGEVIKKIVNDFERAGYDVEYRKFNTADYGVPQTRIRVIIVGVRKDLKKSFNFPNPTHTSKPKKNHQLLSWISISEVLKDIPDPDEDNTLKNHVYSQYKITNRNFTGHRQTDPLKPSPTILARGNGKGGVCAIQHPNNKRRMSVRESAIIQSFPIDFEFVGSMSSCYRQVGNAVPVLFAERLGDQLKELEDEE